MHNSEWTYLTACASGVINDSSSVQRIIMAIRQKIKLTLLLSEELEFGKVRIICIMAHLLRIRPWLG